MAVGTKKPERAASNFDDERALLPTVDVFETGDAVSILVDMPGVRKEDAEVLIGDGILAVEGFVRSEENVNRSNCPTYFRKFRLGNEIDREHLDAEMNHGVLVIHLAKRKLRTVQAVA
jgi:HSP20 family protein